MQIKEGFRYSVRVLWVEASRGRKGGHITDYGVVVRISKSTLKSEIAIEPSWSG